MHQKFAHIKKKQYLCSVNKKTNTAMRNETELRNALKELEARIDMHRECSYNTVIIAEVHALKFALGEVCSL